MRWLYLATNSNTSLTLVCSVTPTAVSVPSGNVIITFCKLGSFEFS